MASAGAARGHGTSLVGDGDARAAEKHAAALAAAELVDDGMRVGLGTGTTVAHLLPVIAARGLKDLRCVATSPGTERAARELGLPLHTLEELGDELEIAIDGADQIAPDGWIVKGGGGAQTREKIVAAAARCFVVIASSDKPVDSLSAPIPLELLQFGYTTTLRLLSPARLRDAHLTPDGGLLADYVGEIGDAPKLATRFDATPGLVEHGLFAPELVSLVLIGGPDGAVQRREGAKHASSPRAAS